MDIEEGHQGGKEEEEGGQPRGYDPYIGVVFQLSFDMAVGPTAISFGGRSPTVGQPPLHAAVGLLPPSALAIGACRAGHVGASNSRWLACPYLRFKRR
jgi:hypothetical protein